MPFPLIDTVVYGAGYVHLLLTHKQSRVIRTVSHASEGVTDAVLLIPGFLGPRSVMLPMELRFERAGTPAFTFDLGLYSTMPFAYIARRLIKVIRQMREEHPSLKRLGIVAHSMGGLIAELLVTNADEHRDLLNGLFDGLEIRLVTLGTPFIGTWAALMGCPIAFSAFEMLPVHPRYRERSGLRQRVEVPFLSIVGEHDILAPPERCAHPDAEWYPMKTDHAGLILRKDVFRIARNFVVTGTTTAGK